MRADDEVFVHWLVAWEFQKFPWPFEYRRVDARTFVFLHSETTRDSQALISIRWEGMAGYAMVIKPRTRSRKVLASLDGLQRDMERAEGMDLKQAVETTFAGLEAVAKTLPMADGRLRIPARRKRQRIGVVQGGLPSLGKRR